MTTVLRRPEPSRSRVLPQSAPRGARRHAGRGLPDGPRAVLPTRRPASVDLSVPDVTLLSSLLEGLQALPDAPPALTALRERVRLAAQDWAERTDWAVVRSVVAVAVSSWIVFVALLLAWMASSHRLG